ncbi:hypothetical protein Q2941_08500 [Bradyrhizobium sp. UFLA05-153]
MGILSRIIPGLIAAAADAKGCIKGAIAGGVAGRYAGHGVVGAAAGCAFLGRRLLRPVRSCRHSSSERSGSRCTIEFYSLSRLRGGSEPVCSSASHA